ncbi:uncharacterized protein LOC144470208 [Augochlora pura]
MELMRKLLGYSDIVKYIKESHRPVGLLDAEDYHLANALEFPEHKVVRRYASKNDKHSSVRKMKGKKKRAHKEHSEHSVRQKKRNHGAASTSHHDVTHKNHKLKKKENKFNRTTCYLQKHQSLCISIVFILVFIILILAAVYYLHKRSRLKARGTRFNWIGRKEDKNTLTDYIEWNDEAVCTCSDVHIGSAKKCPLCNRIYQTASHISKKCLSCMGVKRSTNKSKKKRFGFLQKCFGDKKKEKNLENRDWKKTDRKTVLNKKETFPSSIQRDQQCACCKCNLNNREKMLREEEYRKKILQKLKAKKRKEKKRRKEEMGKAQKYANICFKETCK